MEPSTSPVKRPTGQRRGPSNRLPAASLESRSCTTWSLSASPRDSHRKLTDRPAWRKVRRLDGGALEVLAADSGEQRLVFHWGTPSAAVWFDPLAAIAAKVGLRLVTCSRHGYAGSTPRPGRLVADAAADVTSILDALEADTFAPMGGSGGRPPAPACRPLLPGPWAAAARQP